MHGLQHNVIEIKDTDNSEIERILVFLRPGEHKINVDMTRRDARDILRKVKIKRKPVKKIPLTAALVAGVALLAAAVLILLI